MTTGAYIVATGMLAHQAGALIVIRGASLGGTPRVAAFELAATAAAR